MKVKEKQMREQVVTVSVTCDKCQQPVKTHGFNAFEMDFCVKTGESYPDGGSGNKYELDLCEDCSEEALELLKAAGFVVQESEWDW